MTTQSEYITLTLWESKVRDHLPPEIESIPETSLSLPLPVLGENGQVYLRYMLYSAGIPTGQFVRTNFPTHIIEADYPDFSVIDMQPVPDSWADAAIFFPIETPIDPQNAYPMYYRYQRLSDVYEIVMETYPQDPLIHTQKMFKPLFFQVAPKALHSLYRDLCPEFWEWLSRDPEAIEAG